MLGALTRGAQRRAPEELTVWGSRCDGQIPKSDTWGRDRGSRRPGTALSFPLVWTTIFLNQASVLRQNNWMGVFRCVVTRPHAYGGLQSPGYQLRSPESDTQVWALGMSS